MSQTNSTFQNHTYKLGFIIWSFIIIGGYFLLSYDIPQAPYGLGTDEEIDYFMNSALVAAGQKPFVLLHPGAWVQQLGGGIQYLLGFSITEDQQLFLKNYFYSVAPQLLFVQLKSDCLCRLFCI